MRTWLWRCWLLVAVAGGWTSLTAAATIEVGTTAVLQSALNIAVPGDRILLDNGNYSGVTMSRSGTVANPITISAANPRLAVFTSGILKLSNVTSVIVQGLSFTSPGAALSIDTVSRNVVLAMVGATNCRVTHCSFPVVSTVPGATYFTFLSGTCVSNRIDHCDYGPCSVADCHYVWPCGNATIPGVTSPQDRTPWALGYGPFNPNMARYTAIDHNYFHDHTTPTSNGGETIVLGAIGNTGDYQDTYSLVEYNLFVNCSGDPEIVSVKSSSNVLRYNTVRASAAVFSLRSGNNDSVYGNYFLCGGSGGGIKMSERDHKVYNNYMENTDTSNYPLMLEGGNLYNSGFSHAQVVRAQIVHNTFVNVGRQVLFAHSGGLPVTDTIFANNIITGSITLYSESATSVNPTFAQNLAWTSNPNRAGFINVNPQLTTVNGLSKLASFSPAINAAATNYYPYVTEDMDGQTRSVPRDIGADEYSTAFAPRAPLTTNDVGPGAVDIELSVSPTLGLVGIGSNVVNYAVNVTADSGFTSNVTLTVNGLPPGMSAGFSPAILSGSGSATLSVTNAATLLGGLYRLILSATGSNFTSSFTIMLQVGRRPAHLRWTSTVSGAWDVQGSSHWFNLGGAATDAFYNSDTILLDDTAGVQTNLTLGAGTVVPSLLTNNSSVNNFTISGAGKISGAARLVKLGSSTLTLNTTNDFSGGVTVSGGILNVGNPLALGAAGFAIVTNGGTLDVNGNNINLTTVLLSGTGVGGSGALVNNGADVYPALALMELAGDTTVGGTHRWDLRASGGTFGDPLTASLSTSGQGYNLTKVGTNFIGLVSVTVDPALGNINLTAGTLDIEGDTTGLGNPAKTLTIGSNATFYLFRPTNWLNKVFVLNDGAIINNNQGSNIIIGPMTLSGHGTFDIGGTSLTCSNIFSGAGGLIKTGDAPLFLTAANTYRGSTTVSNGALALLGSGTISGSTNITITAGGVMGVTQRTDGTLTLAAGQNLNGGGTVYGSLIVSANATVAPGSASAIGALTVTNVVTLQGTTLMKLNASANTNDAILGARAINYGGTLAATNLAGSYASGDSFKLFSAINHSGAFAAIKPVIPAVNLAWNTNALTNGVLGIVALPTPPPQIKVAGLSAGSFSLSGSNGVPDWTYYVLASTNLAAATSQWTVVATNSFDHSGNFTVVLPRDPNAPQLFYLVKLQ